MLLGLMGSAGAQTYVPVTVSGFNHDLIAEGAGGPNRAPATTTIAFDQVDASLGYNVMYSTDFRGNNNPTSPPPFGLPTSRIINSANLPGASYTLADYSANNTLFLQGNNENGTLTLQTPGVFSKITILGSSGLAASTFTAQLNFSDGSNFSTAFDVPDWYFGPNFAIKGIGRVGRTSNEGIDRFSGDADNPRLYDNLITLSPPYNNRILTSVTFTKTSSAGRTAILALTGITAVNAPAAPVATAATSIGNNSATANWQSSPSATNYFLDVSESATFSTLVAGYNNLAVGNVLTKEIIGLNQNTTYFYRIRASNNDGTSASSNTVIFTTTADVAPSISCPANISVSNDAGQCGANVTFAASETAGVPASTITYSQQPGSFFPIGTTTVTATATNAVGTSQCTFTVTVNDTEKPTISCPADIDVLPASFNGQVVTYVAPVGTDNCPGAVTTRIAGPPSGSTFPIGTTTVTHQVKDAAGNTTECSFRINVTLPRCGNKDQYVTICYYGVTQCVSEKIAERYLKLGATIGGCGSSKNGRIGAEESGELPLPTCPESLSQPRAGPHDAGSAGPTGGRSYLRGAGPDGPHPADAPREPDRRVQ